MPIFGANIHFFADIGKFLSAFYIEERKEFIAKCKTSLPENCSLDLRKLG